MYAKFYVVLSFYIIIAKYMVDMASKRKLIGCQPFVSRLPRVRIAAD